MKIPLQQLKKTIYISLFLIALGGVGCENSFPGTTSSTFALDEGFKSYWFDGTAEISSFQLTQSRYGAPREGSAVLIFVTEDFLKEEQVKANQKSDKSEVVLKLNRTKNFITGIYPYSIMNSSFTKLGDANPLVKITTSVQEWCGQAFMQLNKKNSLTLKSHSYFEGEADQQLRFEDTLTEDELWHWIRTQPDKIPQGSVTLIPSFEYLRLQHEPIQPYKAEIKFLTTSAQKTLVIAYPALAREIRITFNATPPYLIEQWEEVNLNQPEDRTTAKRIKTLKIPYWQKNKISDESLRDSLGLN
jgi:hypothetical protein